MKKEIKVDSIMCMGCVKNIEKLSRAYDGVKDVSIELETKMVTLEVEDNFSEEKYLEMLDEAGY